MMKTAVFALVLAVTLSLSPAWAASAQEKQVEQMSNAFACDLYAQLASKDGNLFFSPASIQTALAMTWAGARGQTADEMAKTLHLDADPKTHELLGGFINKLNADGKQGGYQLAVANALWGLKGYPFNDAFLTLVRKNYDGNLSDLDFVTDPDGSRRIINDWVAKQTQDRIKDLLPPGIINARTRLVLTNAIYFKGMWDLKFKKELTQDDDFTTAGGAKVKAPFMHQRTRTRYAEDDDVQVLEMTYGKNDLAMRIFLPKKADGLVAFEKQITPDRLSKLASQLRREEVIISLPKFTVESQFSLNETLQNMGMKQAFDPDHANLSGIATVEQLYISAVVHKAFVKVDEEGTEAAAATGVVIMARSAVKPRQPKEFKADHPFIFEIVHQQSGAVLFMGRVAKP